MSKKAKKDPSAALTALVDHVRGEGGHWAEALEIRDGPRGRGVFAKAAVARGELLGRLPFALAVRPAGGCEPLAERCTKGECTRVLALALTVLHELHAAAPRSPYFEFLAASEPPSVPLLWPAEDVVRLAGSSLMPVAHDDTAGAKAAAEAAAAAAAKTFKEDVLPLAEALGEEFLPSAICTQENFAGALAWVMSRGLQGTVSYELGGKGFWPWLRTDGPPSKAVGPFLLPLFDLINHSSHEAERCTTLARAEGETFEIRANRDLAAGEEVLWSYGSHGASELLRTYGFVELTPNPNTAVLLPKADVVAAVLAAAADARRAPKSEKAAAGRLKALEQAGRLPLAFAVRAAADGQMEVPQDLLTVIQVLVMGEAEFAEWRGVGILLGQEYLDPGSLQPVVESLLKLVASSLARYPDEPRAAKAPRLDGAEALCRALRAEERQLLFGLERAALELSAASDLAAGEEGEEEELAGEGDEEEESEDDDEEDEPPPPAARGKKRKP